MKWATIALAGFLVLSGCKKDIQNEPAVRTSIMKYLTTRPGLTDMDVSVRSVSFRQNEADATVHFQAKGNSSAAAGLEMKYILDRKGDEWVVKGRTGEGMKHGASVPGGDSMMPIPGGPASLPPGHPPIPSLPAAGSEK